MVGKVDDLEPNAGGGRLRGSLTVFYSPKYQRFIARSWPKGNGGDTPARKASREAFIASTKLIKQAMPEDVIAATDQTRNAAVLVRDVLMMNSYGKMWSATLPSGKVWQGIRLMDAEIQPALDSISSAIGAMMVRTPIGWQALLPADEGTVLTSAGPASVPSFQTPAASGGTVTGVDGSDGITAVTVDNNVTVTLSPITAGTVLANTTGSLNYPVEVSLDALLDTLGASDGDILLRSGGHWTALSVGGDGQVIGASAGLPVWVDPSGASGLSAVYSMPNVGAGLGGSGSASYGNVVTMFTDTSVDAITLACSPTAGWTYKLAIYEVNSAGIPVITSELTSASVTVAVTGPQTLNVTVPRETMVAGSRYCVCATLSNQTSTTNPAIYAVAGLNPYPSLPLDTTAINGAAVFANTGPVPGDSLGSAPVAVTIAIGVHAFV
jgi:hypothetical protein